MGENGEVVAPSVDISMPQSHTARCETTTYGVGRFIALVPNRLEHLVALGAQLGGVVLVHIPENSTLSTPPGPVPIPTIFATSHLTLFIGPSNRPLLTKRCVSTRDNHGHLVTLELAT